MGCCLGSHFILDCKEFKWNWDLSFFPSPHLFFPQKLLKHQFKVQGEFQKFIIYHQYELQTTAHQQNHVTAYLHQSPTEYNHHQFDTLPPFSAVIVCSDDIMMLMATAYSDWCPWSGSFRNKNNHMGIDLENKDVPTSSNPRHAANFAYHSEFENYVTFQQIWVLTMQGKSHLTI